MTIALYPVIASAWGGELIQLALIVLRIVGSIGFFLILIILIIEGNRKRQGVPPLIRKIVIPRYILAGLLILFLLLLAFVFFAFNR